MPRPLGRTVKAAASAGALAGLVTVAGPATSAWARPPLPLVMDAAFHNDCLSSHNALRARHQAPALTVDQALVSYAKQRIAQVTRYDGLQGGRRGLGTDYGENQYWYRTSPSTRVASCADGVRNWYDGSRFYDYARPGFSARTGLFTQIVWKGTTKLGCARAAGPGAQGHETYVLCVYRAPGNVSDAYRENVFPAR
ncbi:CAP family protein [Nonomuraea sp. NPDC047897]|uniref:CAP family protein n=1 Tax=Nonomuraea sp. NPDC047897 TaxID=3364346 RepID=UPI00371D0CA6